MQLRTFAFLGFAALAACNNTTPPPEPTPEETGVSTGEAVVDRLYATVGNNELSFETLGTFEQRDGVRALIIRATANRYVESVLSFVPDDAFGQANVISERRFEIVLHEGHELNTVLSGLPLFVKVNTFTGSPRSYTARIVIAPRFFDFRGSSAIWIQEEVTPIYVRSTTDNVVYRGRASVQADWLSVNAPDGIPSVTGRPNFRLDWTYTKLHQAIDPHTVPLTFTAGYDDGVEFTKTARVVARVTEFAVTDGDAYDVWPSPACKPEVYNCYHSLPSTTYDYSQCGTYREVLRCTYASACEVQQQPFSLTQQDASSLAPAIASWNGTGSPYSWSAISSIDAYATPECPATPVTLRTVVEHLVYNQNYPPFFEDGTVTDRAGLADSWFFGGTQGAQLLSAIDALTGGGEVQAWFYGEPVACHNCTDNREQGILYYPATGKVIVLEGHHGYDS